MIRIVHALTALAMVSVLFGGPSRADQPAKKVTPKKVAKKVPPRRVARNPWAPRTVDGDYDVFYFGDDGPVPPKPIPEKTGNGKAKDEKPNSNGDSNGDSCTSEDDDSCTDEGNGCCDSGDEDHDCKWCGCDEPHEQWKLYENKCTGLRIGGWVASGITSNPDNPRNPASGDGNLPVTFAYRNEDFQLNQLYLYLEKPLNDDCCCFQLGGRVDLLYGEDYIFTQAAGLETHPDFSNRWNAAAGHNGIGGTARNGLALPQAYLEAGYKDLKVKVGHFYTIIGYEVVTAPQNFFYTHAYTMQYGEPFTHSGVLASWDVNDCWSISAGAVNGWDKLDAVSDHVAFLGGVTWTSKDEDTSLAFAVITGEEDGAAPPTANRTMYSLVFTHQINNCWTYIAQHDHGIQDNAMEVDGGAEDAEWYGLNQYLLFTLNCCWSFGARYEWFNDDDGFRVTGDPALAGHYHEVAVGMNYKPNGNMLIRPEVRWDWFEPHDDLPSGTGPFNNGTERNQFMFAMDAILLF